MAPLQRQNGSSGHDVNGPAGLGHPGYYDGADEIDLRALVTALRRQWWVVALVAAGVFALVATYTFLQEPQFEASSVVLVETQHSSRWSGGGGGMEELLAFRLGNRSLNNEVAILKESVPLAERVSARLFDAHEGGPLTRPVVNGAAPTVEDVSRRMLRHHVRFAPVSQDADLITITATSTDPREAAVLANLYAEEYAQRSQEASRASIASSRDFLAQQEEQQRRQLDEVEARLQQFIATEGAVALDSEAQGAVAQLSSLDAELEQTRVDLEIERTTLQSREAELERVQPGLTRRIASGVEAEMQAINAQLAEYELEAAPYYAADPALRGNETSVQELALLTRNIQQLRARLAELTEQYVDEVMAVGGIDAAGGTGLGYVTQLQRDIVQQRIRIQGLEARAEALRRQVITHEGRLRDIPRQSMQLAQLQRQRQSITETYLFLVRKLQEAQVAEQSQLGYVQVIRRADTPLNPVRPRTNLNLALGLLLGLMGGVGAALLRNALDRKVRQPDDLKARDYSVLATVPDVEPLVAKEFGGRDRVPIASGEVDAGVAVALHPLSPMAESMRRLRTAIGFSLPDRKLKVILVTSGSPKEGKSTTAVNLAISMAKAGKRTLLVDADLRRPMVHDRLGLAKNRGLVELIFQEGAPDWEQYRCPIAASWETFETVFDDLYVVTSGKAVPNPAELLGSQRMRELVADMRDAFDVVILDSPPVLAVSDAVIVSALADATLLVALAGRSDHRALDQVREQMALSQTPMLGVVLNRYRQTSSERYGYAYGYAYGYGGASAFTPSGDGAAGTTIPAPSQ